MHRLFVPIILHVVIFSAVIVFASVAASSFDLEHLVFSWSLLLEVCIIIVFTLFILVRIVVQILTLDFLIMSGGRRSNFPCLLNVHLTGTPQALLRFIFDHLTLACSCLDGLLTVASSNAVPSKASNPSHHLIWFALERFYNAFTISRAWFVREGCHRLVNSVSHRVDVGPDFEPSLGEDQHVVARLDGIETQGDLKGIGSWPEESRILVLVPLVHSHVLAG